MSCCLSIYSNLLKPLAIFYPEAEAYLKGAVAAIIGTIALIKAFPIHPWWRALLTWFTFLFVNFLILVLTAMIAVII